MILASGDAAQDRVQLAFWDAGGDPPPEIVPQQPQGNPGVAYFGPGLDGRHCGDCAHLRRYRNAATWYKCDLRRDNRGGHGGPAWDHRVRWPACARFTALAKASGGMDAIESYGIAQYHYSIARIERAATKGRR